MQRSGNGDDHGEIRALGRIEVEEEVIWMIEISNAVGPWIVIDAAEAGQKEKGSAVVGGSVADGLPFSFRINLHGCEPLRHAFPQIFLKESLALDSVRVTPQHQSSIAQKGQDEVGH